MGLKKNAGIGTGAVAGAAAAAAAGYYFFGSDHAKKHRTTAVKWAGDLKKQVVKEAKQLSKIDKKKVGAIVDGVAHAYASAKRADGKELGKAAAELKNNWHHLAKELKPLAKKAKAKGKRVLNKVAKKAGKAPSKRASARPKRASKRAQ